MITVTSRMKKYRTLRSDDATEFDRSVSQYLEDNWVLYGEPRTVFAGSIFYYIQTLVKFENS